MNQNKFFEKFLENLSKIDEYNVKNIVEIIERDRRTFREILDYLDEALIVLTADDIVFINQKAILLLGFSPNKTPYNIGKAREEIRNIALFDFILASRKDKDFRTEFSYENNETRYYEIEKIEGESAFTIFKIRDITSQKKLESQLKNLESISALNTLAAGIAHEIKNPLAAIDLHTQIIKKAIQKHLISVPDQVDNYLHIIDEETQRLNKILNDFLLSARKRELKLIFTNINRYLDSILEFIQPEMEEHGIHLEKEFDEHIPQIFIDPDYLRQAVINILKNAIEATGASSMKTIRVATFFDPEREAIGITIADTGKGIPEDKLKKIFEPYYSTKEYGTGLGLTLVYKILKEHGGDIKVDSNFNKNCTFKTSFTLFLPTSKGQKLLSFDHSDSE